VRPRRTSRGRARQRPGGSGADRCGLHLVLGRPSQANRQAPRATAKDLAPRCSLRANICARQAADGLKVRAVVSIQHPGTSLGGSPRQRGPGGTMRRHVSGAPARERWRFLGTPASASWNSAKSQSGARSPSPHPTMCWSRRSGIPSRSRAPAPPFTRIAFHVTRLPSTSRSSRASTASSRTPGGTRSGASAPAMGEPTAPPPEGGPPGPPAQLQGGGAAPATRPRRAAAFAPS
jgi:hypothetical protein